MNRVAEHHFSFDFTVSIILPVMLYHAALLQEGFAGKRKLARLISDGYIQLAGNRKLLIYGRLNCTSGKRMHAANRVFFTHQAEALKEGYRPCGHCMRAEYLLWKESR
ncbi:MAG: Ada metal-binding domain-containing protein [Chitinophagaceae bacterium]